MLIFLNRSEKQAAKRRWVQVIKTVRPCQRHRDWSSPVGVTCLPLGNILLPELHKLPPAMITPEVLHGTDLRTWVFTALSTYQQRVAGSQSPLPSPFLLLTDDCLWHLQAASNEYTCFISQKTLNNDILP